MRLAPRGGHDAMRPTLRAMFAPRSIKHCRACGGAGRATRCPPTTTASARSAPVCGTIHYENPLNVVGTVPVWDDKVLLCRRNIEPRYGLWTLPAGFMELGETTEQGALRETVEEAGARVELRGPVHADQRRARRPGAPVLSRAPARHRLRARPGDDRGAPVRRGPRCRGTQLAFRTTQADARALLRRPARRRASACTAPTSS